MYCFFKFLKSLLKKGETIIAIGAMCEQYETDRDKCLIGNNDSERNPISSDTSQENNSLKEV